MIPIRIQPNVNPDYKCLKLLVFNYSNFRPLSSIQYEGQARVGEDHRKVMSLPFFLKVKAPKYGRFDFRD
jgi:hypothetical protein